MSKNYYSGYEHVEDVEVVEDGDRLCARFHDFVNLQESPVGYGTTDSEAIAELAQCTRKESENYKERLAAMMPLFEEARDALCAIDITRAKLHNVRLDLADRMDDVGIPGRWKART